MSTFDLFDLDALLERAHACFPDLVFDRPTILGEGWDNIVVGINEELVLRFPKRRAVEMGTTREIAILGFLGPRLSVELPSLVLDSWNVDPDGPRFAGFSRLRGRAVRDCWTALADRSAVLRSWGAVLREVHGTSTETAPEVGAWRGVEALCSEQDTRRRRAIREVFPRLDEAVARDLSTVWGTLLDDLASSQFEPTLVHGDMNWEHALVDEAGSRIRGLLDVSDVRIDDPALDFAGIVYDLGTAAAREVAAGHGGAAASWLDRARLYARLGDVEQVLFGLDTRDELHVEDGLRRLGRRGITTT